MRCLRAHLKDKRIKMDRAEKQQEISFLAEQFSNSSIALCADCRGLSVKDFTRLRSELRAVGAVGKVVKNTLAKRSVNEALGERDKGQVDKLLSLFSGPSFIVFANDDVVAPAKIFSKFSKEKEAFDIKGGWFEGTCVDEAGVKQISTMPSREEVLSQLLRLINTPATQIVRLLQAPAQQMVQALEAHRSNLEKAQ
jgi:large subunit ribosomal protein L10